MKGMGIPINRLYSFASGLNPQAGEESYGDERFRKFYGSASRLAGDNFGRTLV